MTNEQIQALKAAAEKAKRSMMISGGMEMALENYDFISLATPNTILSLLAERDADNALIAELKPIAAHAQRGWQEAHEQEALVEQAMTRIDEQAKRIAELETSLKAAEINETDARCHVAELEACTLTVKLPTAYDLTGETDGNCSLNNASMKPDANGCYFRRRDVEKSCAAAGITLVVGE